MKEEAEELSETTEEKPQRKMYKATCSECGKETEVPFEPDPNRPVYCKDCFMKKRRSRFGGRRNFRRGFREKEESNY